MRRAVFIYFSFLASFFILVSLFNSWLDVFYWPFWAGGLIGSIVPELDNLIYVFFISPQELTSQRVIFFLKKGSLMSAIKLLIETRYERNNLIFHSLHFILVSFILLFWLITSSGSLLAQGIMFAVLIHLLVNELIKRRYSIWYVLVGFGILLVMGIFA